MATPRRRAPRGSGEQLRGEILAAAKTLLADTGNADAVSIRAVADVVGVTSPSIYLHFADKEALLEAVIADVFVELDEQMNAGPDDLYPLERLCQQGMAYVRFALRSPEHYRLATSAARTEVGHVDLVMRTSAFAHFSDTVVQCMKAGIFTEGDPVPIALELWAAAHGIASLLIAKPYLPWGDVEAVAYRVLRAAGVGRSVSDYLGEPTPEEFAAWRAGLPQR
ncbi:MAG TPA: TetR/AcrR family transcriptional regulator [Mycobacteriales bacterium]|nr:TetR/AcrR family transcriptional regulator [Mycobacteriales bacterium]